MGVLWPLEPATAAKHRLYKGYFDAWWPILLQPSPRSGRSAEVPVELMWIRYPASRAATSASRS